MLTVPTGLFHNRSVKYCVWAYVCKGVRFFFVCAFLYAGLCHTHQHSANAANQTKTAILGMFLPFVLGLRKIASNSARFIVKCLIKVCTFALKFQTKQILL